MGKTVVGILDESKADGKVDVSPDRASTGRTRNNEAMRRAAMTNLLRGYERNIFTFFPQKQKEFHHAPFVFGN
jgi:hypothetical protein